MQRAGVYVSAYDMYDKSFDAIESSMVGGSIEHYQHLSFTLLLLKTLSNSNLGRNYPVEITRLQAPMVMASLIAPALLH
jgi:hypothetical protein